MFSKFDKYKEVFLSPSAVFPSSFVLKQLSTSHYYLPLSANELKQTNLKNIIIMARYINRAVGLEIDRKLTARLPCVTSTSSFHTPTFSYSGISNVGGKEIHFAIFTNTFYNLYK